jgi:hypothetical protein
VIKKVTHHDNFSIRDYVQANSEEIAEKKKTSPFVGLVRLLQDGKVVSKDESANGDGWLNNMTIAIGREFANQKLFNRYNAGSIITPQDLTGHNIDAFGVGSGGSTLDPSYNVTLTGPALCDPMPGLYTSIPINSACLDISGNSDVVKFIESAGPGGTVGEIEQEKSVAPEYAGCPDYYTISKCTCVIDNLEPTYLAVGESVKIDEAVLYATDSTDLEPIPFAHICFAPKFIEKESTFIIEWYIIF